MKKLIGTVAVAALLASAAFAELSISGGALQLWSPVAYNGGDVMTEMRSPWGGGRTASIGFTWVSEDEKAGSAFTFVYNPFSEEAAPDGNRIIWAKPWDFLKLTFGHWDGINDITLANTSSWYPWIRPSTWFAGDSHLYLENEHTGAMIELFPVDGLTVRVGLPFGDKEYKETKLYDKDGNEDATISPVYMESGANKDLAYRMFERLHAEVEYTIADIVGLKLAWVGGANSRDANFSAAGYKSGTDYINVGEIDVYANVIAVENLQLEVGARINILNADKVAKKVASSLIGLKAGYAITDNFSVKADFGVLTYKKYDQGGVSYKYTPDFEFGVGVGVGLTDSLSLDADFRGLLPGKLDGGNKVDPTFSFLVGLSYACSTNATVGIGFQGKTNGGEIGPLSKTSTDSKNFGFAVPILMNVSF